MSSRQGRASLADFQPTILLDSERSPSPDEGGLHTVLSRMQSHVAPKTPKLGAAHQSNIKSIIKVRLARQPCLIRLTCCTPATITLKLPDHHAVRAPLTALRAQPDRLQEKETEMAAISAQRTKFADAELEKLKEADRTSRAEIGTLKGQLKQLAGDFKHNLQLLKDRDTELDLLENQVAAHKATEARQSEARPSPEAQLPAAQEHCRP